MKRLRDKKFSGVEVLVEDIVATLMGWVTGTRAECYAWLSTSSHRDFICNVWQYLVKL